MRAWRGSRSGNSQAVRHPSAVRILERISGEKGGRYATLAVNTPTWFLRFEALAPRSG